MTDYGEPGLPARRLDWDSEAFGFEVWALESPDLAEERIAPTLEEVRRKGGRLVYWIAHEDANPTKETIERFGGALVDRKLTFARRIDGESGIERSAAVGLAYRIGRASSPALIELALDAGAFSRFRLDERMPRTAFETLYTKWIERSCRREIASAVLEAWSPDCELAGMATIAVDGSVGSVGLIAVRASARGRGVGAGLMREAERFLESNGARTLEVVTQGANSLACRLYGSLGYTIEKRATVYHFWLE